MQKEEYIIDSDENSDYMYNLIANTIEKAPRRPPCSEAEAKGAEFLAGELEKICDTVEIEKFEHYPQLGIVSWARRCVIIVLISAAVFLLYPFSPIAISATAFAISFFGLVNIYFQYLRTEQWSPKIYPYKPKESQNVIGVIKPPGEVKKRVVFSGHIDSAYRFNLLQYTHEGYIYFLVGGIATFFNFPIIHIRSLIVSIVGASGTALSVVFNWLAIMIPIGIGVAFIILDIISAKLLDEKGREKIFWGAMSSLTIRTVIFMIEIVVYQILVSILLFNWIMVDPSAVKTSILVLLNYAPFMVALFFFVNKEGVPGALDNLSACAVAACVGKILHDWKKEYPELLPKNTEVVVALFGSEESGSNGAMAFAERHASEYNFIDTTCVNMDTLADSEILQFFTGEASIRLAYPLEIYTLLARCADELGIKYIVTKQPWASGGTDAAGLIRGGLKAGSIVALRYSDYLFYYHTDRDDVPMMNKERRPCNDHGTKWNNRNIRCCMENALKVCMKYLEKKDQE